jgi:hypothetical protein
MNESSLKLTKLQQDLELEKRLAELMEVYKTIRPIVCHEENPSDNFLNNSRNIDVLDDYDQNWYQSEKFQNFMLNLQINKKLEVS